jgi:hypothetical protein
VDLLDRQFTRRGATGKLRKISDKDIVQKRVGY